MTKQRIAEQIQEAVKPLMGPGEWLEGIVVATVGPWQYLTFASVPIALALVLVGSPMLSLAAILAGAACALMAKPYALALTDQAVYVGRLRRGGDLESPEILRPLAELDFARFFPRLRLGDRHYWVTPSYLGEDADEFTRCCLGATGRGPSIAT